MSVGVDAHLDWVSLVNKGVVAVALSSEHRRHNHFVTAAPLAAGETDPLRLKIEAGDCPLDQYSRAPGRRQPQALNSVRGANRGVVLNSVEHHCGRIDGARLHTRVRARAKVIPDNMSSNLLYSGDQGRAPFFAAVASCNHGIARLSVGNQRRVWADRDLWISTDPSLPSASAERGEKVDAADHDDRLVDPAITEFSAHHRNFERAHQADHHT
jgi:hypothetical protein